MPPRGTGRKNWGVAHCLSAASLLAVSALVLSACGSSPPTLGAADLPRRTDGGVLIEATEVVEVVALPGCSLLAEPPPGGCEQQVTMRRVHASIGGRSADTRWQVPYCCLEPIYLVDIVAEASVPGRSLVAVSVDAGVGWV